MKLRPLKIEDACPMLEWMHDETVVENLRGDFLNRTLEDCYKFIECSNTENDVHMAIVDDTDTYMGTVSLKHITKKNAEFAIAIKREAMGKGFSAWAMKEMLYKAFSVYGVEYVYWCVAEYNKRAVRFYDKNGYKRVDASDIEIAGVYTGHQINTYIWYCADKSSSGRINKKEGNKNG